MYAIKPRGMIMILVLVLVALLLIIALAVITGSNTAAQSATAVSIKYRVLNAAEGATNSALDDLVRNPAEKDGTHLSGSLNGANWDAYIRLNNFLGTRSKQYTDPTSGTIDVPVGSAYITGTASEDGGHTTSVDAMIGQGPPLTLPPGAINAVRDVVDSGVMAINTDPSDLFNLHDADVHANRDIQGNTSSVVQGDTFAVGTDQLTGADNTTHPGAAAVAFPLSTAIDEATRTANLSALAGLQLTPAQIQQAGTQTYKGNVYVNGDLVVDSSTITFAQGTYVYVNGNLCISGTGQVNDFNAVPNEIVVAGNVEIANGGGYAIDPARNTLMLVLGLDNATDPTPCSSTNTHAVDFTMGAASPDPIGTIYAANGSIDLTGSSSIVGALDAGKDIILNGSNAKTGMQYSLQQGATTLNTGTLTFESYIEY
jgi:type II secretory pathway pseudopilin PulG